MTDRRQSARARLTSGAALLLALAAAPALAGCRPRTAAAASPGASDTLYIGVAAARTAINEAYFSGVRLAVAELNRTRPAGTRPFGVRMPPLVQPTQVAVAAQFRDDPGVIGVVGHTGSGQTMAAAPIYGDVENGGEHAVLAITPTATNPAVTRAGDWVLRVCPTDDDAAAALARYAADSLHARRVAVIYRNDLFGRDFTRTFAAELARRGTAVSERDPYLADITEYQAYAQRIARSRTDVLVIAGGSGDAGPMIRALRAAGGTAQVLGTDDIAGLSTDTATAREFRGVRYTAFFLADRAATPEAQRFVDAYRTRFGSAPDHRAALSYDAAMLIGRAALAVGPDRRQVRDWVAGIGRARPAFPGVTGAIRFDAEGNAVGKPVLVGEVRP